MKILQICTDLKIGGVQRFVLDLAQELGKKHEVILVTHYSANTDELFVAKPNFRRIALGKKHSGIDISLMLKIARIICREKPDVVHTHVFSLLYVFPSMLFTCRTVRFFHTIHCLAQYEMPSLDFIRKRYYGNKICAVAISNEVYDSAKHYFSKIEFPLIYNGVTNNRDDSDDTDEMILKTICDLRKTASTKIFLNIGVLNETKNQLLLNEATKIVQQHGYNDFHVVIVGSKDEAYAERFEAECSECISYLGISRTPQQLLRAADYFTLSSKYEGMPISLLEALGNGCVPVCVPAGGIPSACKNGYNGILADENNSQALANAMIKALRLSNKEYDLYRNNCLKLFAEKFSMEHCASEYEKLYRDETE